MDNWNAIISECTIKDETKTGKLSGLKIALKDNISTKGVKTTGASKILDNYVPVFNATVVSSILEAGGQINAKASLDELGMGGFGLTAASGPVRNPLDESRVAGGSSSGSAALVAGGYSDVSLGTDTGDSMRIPASYTGIVGFKPTYGRISRFGVIPYAASLEHVGIFSKDVKSNAQMLEVIAGYDLNDQTSSHKAVEDYAALDASLDNIKVGIIDNVLEHIENEDILNAFNDLIKKLSEREIVSQNISLDNDLFKALPTVYKVLANAEAFSNHSNLNGVPFGNRQAGDNLDQIMMETRTKGLGFQVRQRHLIGAYSLMGDNYSRIYEKAKQVRRLIVGDLNKQLEKVDFLIAPAASRIAPKIDEDLYASSTYADNYMVMDNFSGHPGIVIPLGKSQAMPFGLYISSKAFNEKQLLTFAKLIEEIVGEI